MKRTTRMLYVEEISDPDVAASRAPDAVPTIPEITLEYDDDSDGNNTNVQMGTTSEISATSAHASNNNALVARIKNVMNPTNQVQPFDAHAPRVSNQRRGTVPNVFLADMEGMVGSNPMASFRSSHLAERRQSVIEPSAHASGQNKMFQKAKNNLVGHYELRTIEDTMLYIILKPLFICMKISGLFFVLRRRTHGGGCRGFWTNCSPLQVYCAAMCLILTLNFIRSLLAFSKVTDFSPEFFIKLLACLFFYESASRAILSFWACWRKENGLQDLFLNLERICYPDNIIPYETPLKRTMQVFIVLSFVTSLINVITTSYGMFGPEDLREEMNEWFLIPVPPDAPGALIFEIFLLLVTFVNGMVAILSLTFYTVVCYILHKEFEYFCRTFAMKIRPDGLFADDVEKFRISHQRRCKLVAKSDQIFKYYIANTYLTNIPLLCLLLYSIVYADMNSTVAYKIINLFRLVYVFMQMMVLSSAAIMINAQSHAPLANIYGIRTYSATSERQLEIGMFLNSLTGTSIGLTAWDMFVINKPTSLTVFGIIVTYFFLLIQFKDPREDESVCVCSFSRNDTNFTVLDLY